MRDGSYEAESESARAPVTGTAAGHRLLAEAFDAVDALLVILDGDGRVRHLNRAARRLFQPGPAVVDAYLWDSPTSPRTRPRSPPSSLSTCGARRRGSRSVCGSTPSATGTG